MPIQTCVRNQPQDDQACGKRNTSDTPAPDNAAASGSRRKKVRRIAKRSPEEEEATECGRATAKKKKLGPKLKCHRCQMVHRRNDHCQCLIRKNGFLAVMKPPWRLRMSFDAGFVLRSAQQTICGIWKGFGTPNASGTQQVSSLR